MRDGKEGNLRKECVGGQIFTGRFGEEFSSVEVTAITQGEEMDLPGEWSTPRQERTSTAGARSRKPCFWRDF